ncbi:protein-disulfide reductase DsbD family protein [Comamonas endophytica]|uniref:Protein-disulfide reductase DsbD family protein n=1 Tax=Comamonas endophytica TaxID=2949090 RepID=A0ABY6GD09_9BURK|nr:MULTISPECIES: thioredoxin family protein [unclassified Acidovorax]MCD2512708.1 thioredoxin family protein [Acidovorax sp. D4N7]UYG52940.1 protein-disulfide reductase DsbD family protein [Acidovorax sp. 5MLIR]
MNHRLPSRSLPWVLCLWLLALFLLGTAQDSRAQIQLRGLGSSGAVVTTERVRAELVAHAPEGVTPGRPLWLGLSIAHQPEWHTYWKNPGDSGLPTQLDWQLPAGLEAGAIEWPLPRIIRVGPLANYGYEGQLLLPVPVKVAPDFQAPEGDTLTIRLHASWLVCRVECIPEEGDFTLQLPVRSASAMHAQAFAAARARQPAELSGRSTATVAGDRLQVRIEGLPAALRGTDLQLFPETPEVLEHAALGTQAWEGAIWTASWPLSKMRGETPAQLPFVVTPSKAPDAGPVGWRTVAAVEGRWDSAPVAGVSPALEAALAANAQQAAAPATSGGLWMALLGGLLGGLILNLMPCVFPVLAIKIVGFARHDQDRRRLRLGGLAYGAGVLLSFMALGGLLLALRAAGQQLGWGFQLQSPGLVAAMAALFTLLGLNLAGMFEFGRILPQRWSGAQLRHPVAEAFLSGVLAVAIASPCTAPFMGASLGLAIDMPAAQALTVFAALGIGMALPYVLASWLPGLVRWLPRPGAWMQTFRRAMAFPMFATVAWLVWVLGQQSGIDGAGALLALLVALSALVWALTLAGRTRWVLGGALLLGLLWLGSALGPQLAPAAVAAPGNAPEAGADGWQPWSAERVGSLTAAGTPVFVDFTAAWCVTCQVNKHTTLNRAEVRADFAARGVALLRADWTRRDPAITAALAALGRSGVPVYVLYAPGKAPKVMTELLTPAEVHAALETL